MSSFRLSKSAKGKFSRRQDGHDQLLVPLVAYGTSSGVYKLRQQTCEDCEQRVQRRNLAWLSIFFLQVLHFEFRVVEVIIGRVEGGGGGRR
jgi:hypothetical protein